MGYIPGLAAVSVAESNNSIHYLPQNSELEY